MLRRIVSIAVMATVAGLFVAAGLIRLFEKRFIYFPPRYPEGFLLPADPLATQELWFTTEDGVKLNGWFHANPVSSGVLLWFHGNAENVGHGRFRLRQLAKLGVSVMAVDYRGYGKSGGSPSEKGLYRDAQAAYQYLVDVKQVQPKDIFLYGRSLGGAVATDLASRRECGGLILESTFTRARDMARLMFRIPLFEYIPGSRFDSLSKIASVRAPVLIVHGTADSVVPFRMGKQLYDAAREPKGFLALERAGHNDVDEVGGQPYLDRLRGFMDAATIAPSSRPG